MFQHEFNVNTLNSCSTEQIRYIHYLKDIDLWLQKLFFMDEEHFHLLTIIEVCKLTIFDIMSGIKNAKNVKLIIKITKKHRFLCKYDIKKLNKKIILS